MGDEPTELAARCFSAHTPVPSLPPAQAVKRQAGQVCFLPICCAGGKENVLGHGNVTYPRLHNLSSIAQVPFRAMIKHVFKILGFGFVTLPVRPDLFYVWRTSKYHPFFLSQSTPVNDPK